MGDGLGGGGVGEGIGDGVGPTRRGGGGRGGGDRVRRVYPGGLSRGGGAVADTLVKLPLVKLPLMELPLVALGPTTAANGAGSAKEEEELRAYGGSDDEPTVDVDDDTASPADVFVPFGRATVAKGGAKTKDAPSEEVLPTNPNAMFSAPVVLSVGVALLSVTTKAAARFELPELLSVMSDDAPAPASRASVTSMALTAVVLSPARSGGDEGGGDGGGRLEESVWSTKVDRGSTNGGNCGIGRNMPLGKMMFGGGGLTTAVPTLEDSDLMSCAVHCTACCSADPNDGAGDDAGGALSGTT